jgi:hypothetical protein
MFARCVPRQAARKVVRSIRSSHQMPMKRRYSNSSVAPTANSPSPGAALGGLNTELDKLSPRFDISSSQIEILRTPSDFYETLKASGAIIFSYISLFFSPYASQVTLSSAMKHIVLHITTIPILVLAVSRHRVSPQSLLTDRKNRPR